MDPSHSIVGVKTLDLSYSLIPSWDVVALIADELPQLERLALKYATLPFTHRCVDRMLVM